MTTRQKKKVFFSLVTSFIRDFFSKKNRRRTRIITDDAESEGKRREEPKEREKRVGREERVDFQRGWTRVRASVENVRQRTLRGAVHRWRETLVPHSRKDEKKSVSEHLGYHPTWLERFSRRKSRRDSEVHGRRGKKFKGIRRTSRVHSGERNRHVRRGERRERRLFRFRRHRGYLRRKRKRKNSITHAH